jgi:CheY-like chemotaxis protein
MPVTVMIVDDSKLARIVAGKALAQLQPEWRRLEAGGAAEALEIVAAQKIDIALIDFNMADKDGLALAAELHQQFPLMPLAIITANIQDEVVLRAREVGAAFIPKPVTSEGLQPFLSGAALRLRAKKE